MCCNALECVGMLWNAWECFGMLWNAWECFGMLAVLLRMLWGPLKIPLTAIRAVRYMLTLPSEYLQITCRLPSDYLLQTEPQLLSASGCAYEVGTPKKAFLKG